MSDIFTEREKEQIFLFFDSINRVLFLLESKHCTTANNLQSFLFSFICE